MLSPKVCSYVINRDEGECQALRDGQKCRRAASSIHHKVPKSRGGTDHHENLECRCIECHGSIPAGPGKRVMGDSHD